MEGGEPGRKPEKIHDLYHAAETLSPGKISAPAREAITASCLDARFADDAHAVLRSLLLSPVQVEAEEVFDDFVENLPMAKKYLLRIQGRLPWEQQANKGEATEEEAAFHRIHMLHTQLHSLCTNSKKAADLIGYKVRELPKSTIDTLLALLDQLNDFNLSDYIRLLVYCADTKKKRPKRMNFR